MPRLLRAHGLAATQGRGGDSILYGAVPTDWARRELMLRSKDVVSSVQFLA